MTSWKNDHGEELLFVSSKVLLISGNFLSNVGQQFELLHWQFMWVGLDS